MKAETQPRTVFLRIQLRLRIFLVSRDQSKCYYWTFRCLRIFLGTEHCDTRRELLRASFLGVGESKVVSNIDLYLTRNLMDCRERDNQRHSEL